MQDLGNCKNVQDWFRQACIHAIHKSDSARHQADVWLDMASEQSRSGKVDEDIVNKALDDSTTLRQTSFDLAALAAKLHLAAHTG